MNRIDRRALFTSGDAAALLAATGLAAETRPKAGGRLRLALARETGGLAAVVSGAVFDTLTEVAPDGTLRGELATAWRSDGSARIWDIDLREDALFHDGRPLGASEAVAALRAQGRFARIEPVAPFRLRVHLAHANPDLPLLLADPSLAIRAANGAGTGLYAPKRLTPDRHFLGERVARHYKDGQAGWLDSIDAVVIPDPAIRAEALRDGFVDVAELPQSQGLLGRGDFLYRPSAAQIDLAARPDVGIPRVIGTRSALDDGRIAERWWRA